MAKHKHRCKKEAECAYCGKIGKVTDDHVIPQCLFQKPLPPDIVIVPACEYCNNDKSKDDDYLRDYLVTDISSSEHPIAKALFLEKALSSQRQNKSALFRGFREKVRHEPLFTKAGIYVGHGGSIPLDGERIIRIFTRLTRGLYYKIYQKRIPDDYSFDISRWSPELFNSVMEKIPNDQIQRHRCGEVLDCLIGYASEDKFSTAWWLIFYRSESLQNVGVCIHIRTEPKTGFPANQQHQ